MRVTSLHAVTVLAGVSFVAALPSDFCRAGLLTDFSSSNALYQQCTMEDADFDFDGDIDGVDFLQWQRGHGRVGQFMATLGDANRNGFTNQTDLGLWATQFGGSAMGLPDALCFKLYFDPEGIAEGRVTVVVDVADDAPGLVRFGLGPELRLVDVHPQYTANVMQVTLPPPSAGRQRLEAVVQFAALNPLDPPGGPVTIFGLQVPDALPQLGIDDAVGIFDFRDGDFVTVFDPATQATQTFEDEQLDDVTTPVEPPLELHVDLQSGQVSLHNPSDAPVDVNYYEITSVSGALNPAGWLSIDHPNEVSPWLASGGNGPSALSESNLVDTKVIGANQSRTLGAAYAAAVRRRDLRFFFGTPDSGFVPGTVRYLLPPAVSLPEPATALPTLALLAAWMTRRRRAAGCGSPSQEA